MTSQSLINELKDSFTENEKIIFKDSFSLLSNKIEKEYITTNYKKNEFDEYCLDNINLFYSDSYGFPNQLYKGSDLQERESSVKEMARSVKNAVWELCNNIEKNKHLTQLKNFSLASLVEVITKELFLDTTFVKLILIQYIEFGRAHLFNSFCEMFKQ